MSDNDNICVGKSNSLACVMLDGENSESESLSQVHGGQRADEEAVS